MMRLCTLTLLAVCFSAGARPFGGASTGGGAPAAPTNVVIAQQGGASNNVTDSQELTWNASSGATYYAVLRNGSSLSSGGCSGEVTGTSCTDATATNTNVINTYGTETVYAYTMEACNGSGCSSATTANTYFYQAGVSNQGCSTYSYDVTVNCSATAETYPGSAYSISLAYTSGGFQPYANPSLAPEYDLNVGGMTYWVANIYLTDTSGEWYLSTHSRPGGTATGANDIYSAHQLVLINGTSSSYCGTITINTWLSCKVPLSSLGLGTGDWSGYVQSNWYGTGEVSGTTLTIQSTSGGSTANIAVGDILGALSSAGPACLVIGSGSGTTWTISYCSGQSGYAVGSGTVIYDAQVYVSSVTSGTGPDNGGLITGQSMPNGTFFFGPTPNSSTQWGLADGNDGSIPSAGSSGSPVSFGSQRISLYKPDLSVNETTTAYVDNFGWTAD